MEVIIYLLAALGIGVLLWMNILATFAVRHDATLTRFQVNSQTIIIWLFPLLGAGLVLHLVWQQYPDVIPKAWVPWPFKRQSMENQENLIETVKRMTYRISMDIPVTTAVIYQAIVAGMEGILVFDNALTIGSKTAPLRSAGRSYRCAF